MFMVDHVCTRCHMKRITKQDLYRSGRRLRSAGIGRKDAIRLLPLCRTCCTLVMSARLGLRANGSGHGMSKTPPACPAMQIQGRDISASWVDEVAPLPET